MNTISVNLKRYLITLCLVIILNACSHSESTTYLQNDELCPDYETIQTGENDSWEELITSYKDNIEDVNGLFTSLIPLNEAEISLIGGNTYKAELLKEKFKFVYRLFYPKSKSNSEKLIIRYLFFVDEIQTNLVNLDSSDFNYDVTLLPGQENEFIITLPSLSEGVHDIVFVGIPNPQKEIALNEAFSIYYKRFSFVVGDGDSKPILREFIKLSDVESSPSISSLLLSLDKSLMVWSYPQDKLTLSVNDPLNFFIHAGYPEVGNQVLQPANAKFAILLLNDYKQIPFTDENSNILYVEVDDNTGYASIPVNLSSYNTLGLHHIIAIRVDNPGILSCHLNGAVDNQYLPADLTAMHVLINVVQEK